MTLSRAMVLDAPRTPLAMREIDIGAPGPGEVRLKVSACGVCRTDLHIVDGELPRRRLPLVPGHEIVGRIDALGAGVSRFRIGDRVGVPWLGSTCGHCWYCKHQLENLCDEPVFNGYQRDGGYAEYAVTDAAYCFALPDEFDDAHAAPLLCAGLIGHRALRFAPDAHRLGIYGFGAAAHLMAQVAVLQGRRVFAFTKPGDSGGQAFARSLGCIWAGASTDAAPEPLDAALIFAPVGPLVPVALAGTRKGGAVICAGIHMSDIPAFSYDLLWGERIVRSVANLTRTDGDEFLAIAARLGLRPVITTFPLAQANEALAVVRNGTINGTAVLLCS